MLWSTGRIVHMYIVFAFSWRRDSKNKKFYSKIVEQKKKKEEARKIETIFYYMCRDRFLMLFLSSRVIGPRPFNNK